MSHVLWECSAYSSTRASFMKKLQELLEEKSIIASVSELCNCATRSHFALYVRMYVFMYVCTYVCTYVCMYVCMYVRT